MTSLTLMVAMTCTNGIGQGSRLPWRLPAEMAYFARVTKAAPADQNNIVIMGRKTWESIPKIRRPLIERINVIITRNAEYDAGQSHQGLPTYVESSLDTALSRVARNTSEVSIHRRFVIGGASAYNDSLALENTSPTSHIVDRILLTQVLSPAFEGCDVFFPQFRNTPGWNRASHAELEAWVGFEVAKGIQKENGVEYEYQMWVRNA